MSPPAPEPGRSGERLAATLSPGGFGVIIVPCEESAAEVVGLVVDAEGLGFDAVWIADHVVPQFGGDRRWTADCWSVLAAAAVATSRIVVGSMVSPLPLYDTGALADTIATVAELAPGRLVAGLGAGWNPDDWAERGRHTSGPPTRCDDVVPLVEQLTARLDRNLGPRRPPVIIGSFGRRLAGRTAHLVDGWVSFGPPSVWAERTTPRTGVPPAIAAMSHITELADMPALADAAHVAVMLTPDVSLVSIDQSRHRASVGAG